MLNNDLIIKKLKRLEIRALELGEIPIGSIIVSNNEIITETYNLKESKKCSIYHAEILSIIKASKKKKDWRLNDYVLYTTLYPCPMCASAIAQSRIKTVYYLYDTRNNYEKIISEKLLKNVEVKKINVDDDYLDVFFNKIRNKL